MNSRRYSKFLVGLTTSLVVFSLFITPVPATAGNATRAPIAFDTMQLKDDVGELSVSTALNSSPVMFIENIGQFGDGARFQVRGGNGTIWLAEDAFWVTVMEKASASDVLSYVDREKGFALPTPTGREAMNNNDLGKGVSIRFSFAGANPTPNIEPFNRLDTHVSYFIGSDSEKWKADVPTWGGVRYKDLYPGIDLEITGENGHLVQRISARNGANLDAVQLQVDGTDEMTLDGNLLRLTTVGEEYTLPLLQVSNAGSAKLSSPVIVGNQITSPFGNPQNEAATVNPQSGISDLLYATFLGGSGNDYGTNIAVDASGAAYVTGYTSSSDFPTTPGAFDMNFNAGVDAFVVKLNTAGSALAYATFLGGSGNDYGYGIAVDSSSAAYVTGYTYSSNFPTTPGAFDTSFNSTSYYHDAFVVKLNAAGSVLAYGTFLGGSGNDHAHAVAIDVNGAAYVTGYASSSDFPTTPGTFDTSFNGGTDAFVVKLNAAGSTLTYATFLGGSGNEDGFDIAIDTSGAAYVTGYTYSSNFPTIPGAFDTSFNGGTDAFVVKLNAAGTALIYATYLGGSMADFCDSIAVDLSGAAYVTGYTASNNFPTTSGAFDTSFDGSDDAFVVKLNLAGSALSYSTFLGGSGHDHGHAISIDASGAAYVLGETEGYAFPTTPGAFDTSFNGGSYDAFVVKLNTTGSVLAYATLLGGSGDEYGTGIAIDSSGAAYVTSYTYSSNFPTTPGAFDTTYNGNGDVFVVKMALEGAIDPPTGKMPIVFVHGINFFPPQLIGCTDTKYDPTSDEFARSYFHNADDMLKTDGGYSNSDIFYARLVSNPCYTPPLEDNVEELVKAIVAAKDATHQSKVILITHSMGGLVARAYIEGPDYKKRNDVAALFTFGSPHLGVPDDIWSGILGPAGKKGLGAYCDLYQPAVCDFSVSGMNGIFGFNFKHMMRAPDVTYHTTSGDAEERNAKGQLMDALFLWTPNDGIVPTWSGNGLLSLGATIDRLQTDENHSIFGPYSYFSTRDGGASTSYTDCIKKVLVDGASNCGTVSAASVTQQDIPATLAQHTPIEYGALLSGQTATRNISLEGGLTLFASQWQDGTLAFTLVDPNGQTIDPAFAAANPGIVTYTEDATAATYYFPNAMAGTWQMVLQAVSVPASAAFTTFAAFDSNVTLAGSTDKQWYIPGASATITATLGGSPSSATVTAAILRADGITDTLPLSSTGGGQYQASFTVPAAPGYAEVRLVASGTTASSLSFERGTSLIFQISPNTFILNNTYGDALVASDLNVTVGIDAAVSGKVGLSADLVDGSGNFVAHALTIQDVTAGTPTLTLQFDGADIFASQRNGPYTLTNVLLTDESGATLVTQQAQAVYITAPYLYTDFAPNRIYLPLILR